MIKFIIFFKFEFWFQALIFSLITPDITKSIITFSMREIIACQCPDVVSLRKSLNIKISKNSQMKTFAEFKFFHAKTYLFQNVYITFLKCFYWKYQKEKHKIKINQHHYKDKQIFIEIKTLFCSI
jgi:hypothetical protein